MATTNYRARGRKLDTAAPDVQPIVLTRAQYAKRWNVGLNTLDKAIAAGIVQAVRFGPKTIRVIDAPPRPAAE
jgi:hypothetical protein